MVFNQFGQTPAREVKNILNFSILRNYVIDTAPDYGESEQVIGSSNTSFFICVKIPSLKNLRSS